MTVTTVPEHGSLSVYPDGSFVFLPDQGYSGSDSFTYRLTDGVAASDVATVSIDYAEEGKYNLCADTGSEPRPAAHMPSDSKKFQQVSAKPHVIVHVICTIDPRFRGYLTVVPNRAFARTREDGSFRLPFPLPSGKYQLAAFHPKYLKAVREVEVVPGKPSPPVGLALPSE